MARSVTTESLQEENHSLRAEAEKLTQSLTRLEFVSPPSVEVNVKDLADEGFVYILEEVRNEYSGENPFANHYKIGVTTQNPERVLEEIRPGNPRKLRLKRCEVVSSYEDAEKRLRWNLKEWQLTTKGNEWYLVKDSQRPQFYGKFYGILQQFGVKDPEDIPKGWLQYDNPIQDDRVWIASGGVFYHSSTHCNILQRKGRKFYPIIKTKVSEYKRRPCRLCVQGVIDRSRNLSFSEELLHKISY